MHEIYSQALFGALGGLTRGFVGLIKHYRTTKKPKLSPKYLLITLIGSAIIGMTTALLLPNDYKISLASGYLGIDVIENIIKIYSKKQTLFR